MKYNGSYRKREKEKHILGEDVLYEEKTLLRHNRISALRVLIIVLGLLIAFALLFFAVRAIFEIENVTVSGCERYTADEILANCGITYGDFMFSFPSSRVREHITQEFPYVESVEVKRIYPSSVSITVTEYDRSYVFCQLDKYVLFAHDLKVLEVDDSNVWGDDTLLLEIPEVSRALVGKKIEFASPERTEYITGFISALDVIDIEQRIDSITLTDYFNIRMQCEDRIFITFGKYYDKEMKLKIQTLNEIMKSEKVKNAAAATVDISDLKQQSVVPYDRVEDIKSKT